MRSNQRCSRVSTSGAPFAADTGSCVDEAFAGACRASSFNDSQGVTTSAIASDSNMPTEALIGIGRM